MSVTRIIRPATAGGCGPLFATQPSPVRSVSKDKLSTQITVAVYYSFTMPIGMFKSSTEILTWTAGRDSYVRIGTEIHHCPDLVPEIRRRRNQPNDPFTLEHQLAVP
jgi:hypothetical protein